MCQYNHWSPWTVFVNYHVIMEQFIAEVFYYFVFVLSALWRFETDRCGVAHSCLEEVSTYGFLCPFLAENIPYFWVVFVTSWWNSIGNLSHFKLRYSSSVWCFTSKWIISSLLCGMSNFSYFQRLRLRVLKIDANTIYVIGNALKVFVMVYDYF